MGNSVYFLARTVGAFLGGVVLMRFSASKFFTANSCLALVSLVGLIFSRNLTMILFFVALFGLGYANLFSIIFSLSMQKMPQKTNEVSALLIVGVSGGAVLPPLLGVITDTFGTQGSALITLAIVWVYMVALIPFVRNVRPSGNEN